VSRQPQPVFRFKGQKDRILHQVIKLCWRNSHYCALVLNKSEIFVILIQSKIFIE